MKWDPKLYSTWCRNGYNLRITLVNSKVVSASTANPGGIAVSATQAQKDQDALLVSWNRRPRDISKYPILKKVKDYQDWSLKMKSQLKADMLYLITKGGWTIASNCDPGSDEELGLLQLNFFKQILFAVLQNPKGKGLRNIHPEDSLYV